MVKIKATTFETLQMCLDMMKKTGKDVPEIILEASIDESAELFKELLQCGRYNEVIFEAGLESKNPLKVSDSISEESKTPIEKPNDINNKEEHTEIQNETKQNEKTISQMIIEILREKGEATIVELTLSTGKKRSSIYTCCKLLMKKGIIERKSRGVYRLSDNNSEKVENNKAENEKAENKESIEKAEEVKIELQTDTSVQQAEKEETKQPEEEDAKTESECSEEGKLDELNVEETKEVVQTTGVKFSERVCLNIFTSQRYEEVVNYIFTKKTFSVETLREKLPNYDNELVSVIQLALKGKYIQEIREGRYSVSDVYRLYYYILKMERPVSFGTILSNIRMQPKELGIAINTAIDKGIIIIQKVKINEGGTAYRAVTFS